VLSKRILHITLADSDPEYFLVCKNVSKVVLKPKSGDRINRFIFFKIEIVYNCYSKIIIVRSINCNYYNRVD